VPEAGKQLAAEHADATLLVNVADFFIPKVISDPAEGNLGNYPWRPRIRCRIGFPSINVSIRRDK
jgi:hypothetical protein